MDAEARARAEARVGTILQGKYRLDRVLGVGGMAAVYAATHRNKKQFAVKVLHRELSLSGHLRARFLREGYAANAVQHRGTVAVIDDDVTDDGEVFLVMELLEGETVEELWVRSGRRLPADVVVRIGVQLLDVLAAAHAHGVVHRDIKPGNLLITRDGNVKVLDFGIARLLDSMMRITTQSGITFGTPAFMSPEQAQGRTEIGPASDVWAVGATLFTLLSGHYVHEGENPQAMILRAATKPARRIGEVFPVPAALAAVVDRALERDSGKRWPGAAAMRDALRDALMIEPSTLGFQLATTLHALPGDSPPSSRRRRSQAPGSEAPTHFALVAAPSVRPRWERWPPVAVSFAMMVGGLSLLGLALALHSSGGRSTKGEAAQVRVAAPAQGNEAPAVGVERLVDLPPAPALDLPVPRAAAPAATGTASLVSSGSPDRSAPIPPGPKKSAAQVAAPADCNPPYRLDAAGKKRWRPECL
jgi:serine/threonine-protein kinase